MSDNKKKLTSFVGAIVGRRKSGKTHLLVSMLRSDCFKHYNWDFVVWMSPTAHQQHDIWNRISKKGILLVDYISNEVIQLLMQYQQQRKNFGHVLIVIDDFSNDFRQLSIDEDLISKLAFIGRHFNISVVWLAQRWTQLSTSYRSQLDFFFFSGSPNKRELSLVFQEYADTLEFKDFVSKCNATFNQDYQWLYFENKAGRVVSQQL
jgi:hypothetical protein